MERHVHILNIINTQSAMLIENTMLYDARTRSEQAALQAYADIFRAVTGGKLLILTREDVRASLGVPVRGSMTVSKAEELAQGREFLRENLANSKVIHSSDEESIVLAVGEAVANGIKHANGCVLQVFVKRNLIQVYVSDQGPGIEFRSLPKSTLVSGYSTKRSLGVGFDVMLNCASKLLLSSDVRGTDVVLEFEQKAHT